jgi:glutaredoxin
MARDERQLLALLDQKKVRYKMVFIDEDEEAKTRMLQAGIKRMPQLHTGGKFIGDASQVEKLDQARELDLKLGLGRGLERRDDGGRDRERDRERDQERERERAKEKQQPRVVQSKPVQPKQVQSKPKPIVKAYEDPLASPVPGARSMEEPKDKAKVEDAVESVQAFLMSDSEDSDGSSGNKAGGVSPRGKVVTVGGGRSNTVTVMSGARGSIGTNNKQSDSDSDSDGDSADQPRRNNIVSSGVMPSSKPTNIVSSGVISNKPSRSLIMGGGGGGLGQSLDISKRSEDSRAKKSDNEKMLAASLGSSLSGLSSMSGLGAYKPKPRAVNQKPGHAKALAALGLSSDSDDSDAEEQQSGRGQKDTHDVKSLSGGGGDISTTSFDFDSDDDHHNSAKAKSGKEGGGVIQIKTNPLDKASTPKDSRTGEAAGGGGAGAALGGLGLSPSMFGGTPEGMRSALKAPLEKPLKPLSELDSLVLIDKGSSKDKTPATASSGVSSGKGSEMVEEMEDIEDMSMDEGLEFFSVTSKPHPAANMPTPSKSIKSPVQPAQSNKTNCLGTGPPQGSSQSAPTGSGNAGRLSNRRGLGGNGGRATATAMTMMSDSDSESDMEVSSNQPKPGGRSMLGNSGQLGSTGGSAGGWSMMGSSRQLDNTGGSVQLGNTGGSGQLGNSGGSGQLAELGASSTDKVTDDDSWIFQDDWASEDVAPSKPSENDPIEPLPSPLRSGRSLTQSTSASSVASSGGLRNRPASPLLPSARPGGAVLSPAAPTPPPTASSSSSPAGKAPSVPASPLLSGGKPPPHRRPAVGSSSSEMVEEMEDIEDMSMDEGLEFFSVTSKPHPAANKAAAMIAPVQPATLMASKRDGGRNSFSASGGAAAAAAAARAAQSSGSSHRPPSPSPTPPAAPPSAANKAIASFVTETSSLPRLGQQKVELNAQVEELEDEVTELRAAMQLLKAENLKLKEGKEKWKKAAEAKEEELHAEKERADAAEAAAATASTQEVPVVNGGSGMEANSRAQEAEALVKTLQMELDEARSNALTAAGQAGQVRVIHSRLAARVHTH